MRVRDGVPAVTDGPFVEAKEQFAGYLAVDCASLDRAVEIAARWPDAKHFAMEVRPMVEQPTAPTRKAVVERYFDGFRTSDHPLILGLLTEDVAWDLPGFKHLVGKEAFDGEIENEEFAGPPTLVLDRLVEEGDTVVAIGTGEGRRRTGEAFRFAYCDAFTFADALIRRVESYVVPLP